MTKEEAKFARGDGGRVCVCVCAWGCPSEVWANTKGRGGVGVRRLAIVE